MKNPYYMMTVLLVSVVLTGCASGPAFTDYSPAIPEAATESGRIYFYRPSAVGFAIQPLVKVNDIAVGKAKPQGFFHVDRPAGRYEISTSTEAKRNLSLELEAGDERYVRLDVKMGLFVGHIKPVLVDKDTAMKQISKTKHIE